MEKSYCIELAPQAWKRSGVNFAEHKFFDKQQQEKVAFGLYMVRQHGDDKPFDSAVRMDVTFYMPIPASRKKKEKSIYHSKMPDLDNLLKFLLDTAVKSGIMSDDRIVCCIDARKVYDRKPRVEFKIVEIT